MLNGLGLMMTSLKIGNKKSRIAVVPVGLLLLGSGAFSGLLFYEKITTDRTFSAYVRYGGSLTLIGWALLAAV